jgi:hypothetical protein
MQCGDKCSKLIFLDVLQFIDKQDDSCSCTLCRSTNLFE